MNIGTGKRMPVQRGNILTRLRKRKEKMSKIVFVVPDMAGGGSERVISLLANEFVKRE